MMTGTPNQVTVATVQPVPIQQAQPCKFNGRRKFRRACCCIGFLLVLNVFLLMHISHSVGAITWFVMNGSYSYHDTTYMFVPGGAQSLCNDLCVDLCIYGDVDCQLESCLNVCNEQLLIAGNPDDFRPLPEAMEAMEGDVLEVEDPQSVLDGMEMGIEKLADRLRLMKETYANNCAVNPALFGCTLQRSAIVGAIKSLKQSVSAYDEYAVSFEMDIRVQVWMVDIDTVTTEP